MLDMESEDLRTGFATYCVTLDESLPFLGLSFFISEVRIPPLRAVENIR